MRFHLRRFVCRLALLCCILIGVYILSFTPSGSGLNENDKRQWNNMLVTRKASSENPTVMMYDPDTDPAGLLSIAAGQHGDRIAKQLNLRLPNISRNLTIIVYPHLPAEVHAGGGQFITDNCAVQACVLTSTVTSDEAEADVVLFRDNLPAYSRFKRPARQLWGLFMLESPYRADSTALVLERYNISFTASYRTDSTIVTPYEKFVSFSKNNKLPAKPEKDYTLGKDQLVAAFISNCYASNKRMEYITELQDYIDVHVYGLCGNYSCFKLGSGEQKCYDMIKKDYKFYLSFENANCEDYITEKFYWNALLNDVVPVVMGASLSQYEAVAPPGSFIHVDQFESPRHLASYLLQLDQDAEQYNQYFRWKGTGEFINTKFWCRLCAMAHYMQDHPEPTRDTFEWWYGDKQKSRCVPRSRTIPWSSWKHYHKNTTRTIFTQSQEEY